MLNVFTIVLNGMPWLHYVHRSLTQCHIDWKWTIVHGFADPIGDTAWCKSIPTPEDDGTLASILKWALTDDRIDVIAKDRWPGKTAMCNTALESFTETGVLIQMDADEVWTPMQLRILTGLFDQHPAAGGAMFLCRYWVGPYRYVCTPGAFGNHVEYEWVRAWRFTPGMTFERHEPPILKGVSQYIGHRDTAQLGLVFDHYAYATRKQIEFKRAYYGSEYDPESWDRLQTMHGVVDLHDVLPWVRSSVMSYEG